MKWIKNKPEKEGWYFWKRSTTVIDSFRWNCYYIMKEDDGVSFWEAGVDVCSPTGGWWSKIEIGHEPRSH